MFVYILLKIIDIIIRIITAIALVPLGAFLLFLSIMATDDPHSPIFLILILVLQCCSILFLIFILCINPKFIIEVFPEKWRNNSILINILIRIPIYLITLLALYIFLNNPSLWKNNIFFKQKSQSTYATNQQHKPFSLKKFALAYWKSL